MTHRRIDRLSGQVSRLLKFYEVEAIVFAELAVVRTLLEENATYDKLKSSLESVNNSGNSDVYKV